MAKFRIAVPLFVAALIASSPALAQLNNAGQIPGFGAGIHPKVMIIFDTSRSMQHMPQSDLTDLSVLYNWPAIDYFNDAGNYNYLNNDFDPSTPTAECLNRFCTAKRVLYNVLPAYSSDVQLGLAGYYQYRTAYTPPTGAASCVYDVLAAPGEAKTFRSSVPGLNGTYVAPPAINANCRTILSDGGVDPLSLYLITGVTTSAGTTVSCTVNSNIAPGPWGANRPELALSGCNNSQVAAYLPTAPATPTYGAGVSAATSTMWVTTNNAANCAVPGVAFRYGPALGFRDFISGPVGVIDAGVPNMFLGSSPIMAAAAPPSGLLWTGQATGCSQAAPCDLVTTGTGVAFDGRRSVRNFFTDAGSGDITVNPWVYSPDGGNQSTVLATIPALSDGGCEFAPGVPATTGTDYFKATGTMADWGFSNTYNCAYGGVGCRVRFDQILPGAAVNYYIGAPPSQHTWAAPGSAPLYTCDVTGSTTGGTWTYGGNTIANINALGVGATCPDQNGVTSAIIGGQALNGAAFCSPATPCDLRDGGAGLNVDPTLYLSPLAAPGSLRDAGFGVYDYPTIQLTAYTQACPGPAVAGAWFTDNGTIFPSCSLPGGCTMTFDSRDNSAGGGPPNQVHRSGSIPSYVDNGATYSYSGVSALTTDKWETAMATASCAASVTLSSGETLPSGTVCNAGEPCELSNVVPICRNPGDLSLMVCPPGNEPPSLRRCQYTSSQFVYTAPAYGVCKYTRYQSKYGTDWCSYDVHTWTPQPPPSGCDHYNPTCRFEATLYPYSYLDPVSYCQVSGATRPWGGSTPTTYVYSYNTKGGEYLGRKDVIYNPTFPATALLDDRNWCEPASPFAYTAFSSSCPPAITAANNASFFSDTNCAAGRECLLRVRGDAGVDYPTGRASYFSPAAIIPEPYNPATPLCLAPDRTAGETAQFNPADYMPNVAGGSIDGQPPTVAALTVDLNSNGFSPVTTFSGLTLGTYTLTISAYQEAAGPDDAKMRVWAKQGAGAWGIVGLYSVSNVSPAQPLYSASLTITNPPSLNIVFQFINDWYCATCTQVDRNLRVRAATLSRSPTNFCAGVGNISATRVNLRSDWFDPGQPSNTPPFVDFSTQQLVRNSGWSLSNDAGSDVFVALASNNLAAVQQALGPCVRPTNLTSATSGGLCMADLSNCGNGTSDCQSNDAGLPDFTPLYGSLANARDFMINELANDDGSYLCRSYYVLLVTDGLESTPRNYTQADLTSVVTQMRTTVSTAPARTTDVKTYVIGFGAGLTSDAGYTDVDVIARAGGTALRVNPTPTSVYDAFLFDNVNGKALAATNQSELGQALNWVFSTIASGRYARSRPVLSASGTRLYQGYFERNVLDGGSTPELKGNVVAYQIDINGSLTRKWDYQTKIDAQATASRDVRAALSTGDGGVRLVNFVATNNDVTATMDSLWGTVDAGVGVVAFVRNDGKGSGTNETYAPVVAPRSTRAGAVMFSAPTLVGPGRPEWRPSYGGNTGEASQAAYTAFFDNWVNRPQRVLFGSADGLWRGVVEGNVCANEADPVACANGREAWGLVPPEALRSMQTIRQGGALPIVDGTNTAADVCWPVSGTNAADCNANEWRTVAISAMRGGGRGIIAADVTDGGYPIPLWEFNGNVSDYRLGYTFSTPAVGRVTIDGAGTKRWVAFMAGGYNDDAAGHDGNSFFMFDIETGKPVIGSSAGHNQTVWQVGSDGTSMTGRTALFRPVNPATVDVRSAYFGTTDGRLYDMRLKLSGAAHPQDDWEPTVFFRPRCSGGTCGGGDPARDDAKKYPGFTANTPIWKMNKTTGAQVTTGCTLPLRSGGACGIYDVDPKFMNRPTLATASDSALQRPDLYIGTGDAIDVSNPTDQNFIFAIHDTATPAARRTNFSSINPHKTSTGDHYGQAMWVYALDPGEKVLSEPALVGGAVIFATYVPIGSGCYALGDSYLYAFDPVTGAPRASLLDPATGTYSPVLRLTGAGPLSDLVAIGGRIFFSPTEFSSGTPQSREVRRANYRGVIHGWRRVR